ncbi:MAG TPA: RNase adapter RapZ, partial [Alphaproteobacteria bacterium]|nr:RNase adapter RapZ [Alphaproteobacteria bacterium]
MTEAPPSSSPKRRIVLLTGMSGAGLSTALKAFEDLGYESVDNLRLGLIPALVEDTHANTHALAVAIDTRNAMFAVDDLLRIVHQLADKPD